VAFEKEHIMRCSSAEWIARNGCALRWCHRGVGRQTEETVGFPEWNAQFSVWKTTGKDSSEAYAIAWQNCAVYPLFPSGMTSHSKIAQFNWECIGRSTVCSKRIYSCDILTRVLGVHHIRFCTPYGCSTLPVLAPILKRLWDVSSAEILWN